MTCWISLTTDLIWLCLELLEVNIRKDLCPFSFLIPKLPKIWTVVKSLRRKVLLRLYVGTSWFGYVRGLGHKGERKHFKKNNGVFAVPTWWMVPLKLHHWLLGINSLFISHLTSLPDVRAALSHSAPPMCVDWRGTWTSARIIQWEDPPQRQAERLDTSSQSGGGALASTPREERKLQSSMFYHKNALCAFL